MGKGRIISAHGEGRYTLEILEDRTRAEANRATAAQRVSQIDAKISGLETDLDHQQAAVDLIASDLDDAIAAYQTATASEDGDPDGELKEEMAGISEILVKAAADRDAIARNIRAAKAELISLQSRINRIDALPSLRQIDAWCADYTEDLSGEVATAEVPGEIGQVVIKPGYSDGAAWSATEAGAMQPALSGTPASVFYNLAMLPGWQKWRPTFRIATVSNIANDLCDITLDPATSSQQDLNVNAQASYAGVPIMYMDCNGSAFEEGDRALVAFSGNTGSPMVVGFESAPRVCFTPFSVTMSFPFVVSTSHTVTDTDPEVEGFCASITPGLDGLADMTERQKARFGVGVLIYFPEGGVRQLTSTTDEVDSSLEWGVANTSYTASTTSGDTYYTVSFNLKQAPLQGVGIALAYNASTSTVMGCEDTGPGTGFTYPNGYTLIFSSTITVGSLIVDLADADLCLASPLHVDAFGSSGNDTVEAIAIAGRDFTCSAQQGGSPGEYYIEIGFEAMTYSEIGTSAVSTLSRQKYAAFIVGAQGQVTQVEAEGRPTEEQIIA